MPHPGQARPGEHAAHRARDDEVVGTVTDTAVRVVLEMIADPRTDKSLHGLRENIDQLRTGGACPEGQTLVLP